MPLKLYAASLMAYKTEDYLTKTSHTAGYFLANSEEEAVGLATKAADVHWDGAEGWNHSIPVVHEVPYEVLEEILAAGR